MRKQVKIFLTISLMVYATISSAQSAALSDITGSQSEFPQFAPNVFPPSPDAYQFTKYGSLPIGINTGTAQYTLPVYTIQSGSLSHSISVNYSSNGVKVDEMATRVGINWSLKAGGMITRTVMDLPDEAPGVLPTFFHGPITWDTMYSTSYDLYNWVKQASFSSRPDFQPDEYSFNVDGYSGKFLRRENGEFTLLTSSAMKIQENGDYTFILTAPTGIKYFFYLYEVAKNYSYPENTSLEWVPALVPTAWYLTKILSPTRDSIVFNYTALLSDPDSVISYKNGVSQDYNTACNNGFYVNASEYELGLGFNAPFVGLSSSTYSYTTLIQQTDNKPDYLSSITFDGGTVQFIYSSRLDVLHEKKLDSIKVIRASDSKLIHCVALQYTYSHALPDTYDTYFLPVGNYTNTDSAALRRRLFLTAFDEVSNDLSSKQRQTFEYENIDSLPPRLSFSQDRYGSFNGKINSLFFPNDTWFDWFIGANQYGGDRTYNFKYAKRGVLKKISYPTGGYTQFEYEPNKTEAQYSFIYQRDSIFVNFDTSLYVGQQMVSDTMYFDGNSILQLKIFCDWASVPINTADTAFEGTYHIGLTIDNLTEGYCTTCGVTVEPIIDQSDGTYGMTLPSGMYRITAIANRPHLKAKIVLNKIWKVYDRSDSSGIAGIRVKSIADFASDGQESNRREFVYGNWDDSTSSSGTGITSNETKGKEVSMTRTMLGEGIGGYNTIHSNSALPNYITENNTVFYKKVIELNRASNGKNNGGTEYEFYHDDKWYPIPLTFTWGPLIFDPVPYVPPGAPYMNNDYRTGQIKSTRVFTYQQKYGTRSVLQESNNYYSVDTSNLIIDTFLVSKWVIRMENVMYPDWIYLYNYDLYRYWRYFGFMKQDSMVQKMYTSTGQLVNKVVYNTYNSHNYKPNNINFYSSAGDIKNVTRLYVCDVTSLGMPDYNLYQAMRDSNMIDPLLEERTNIGSQFSHVELLEKRLSFGQFNGLYLPDSIFSAQRSGTEYLEMKYQQYDSTGNLLQYTGKDGVITSIVWGYNKKYPVAKIIGKTYSNVLSESSINMSVVNNPSSDAALKTELDKLQALSDCFATTYIYDPLIGLKNETDPNGKTTYYQYDNFNRLTLIRDKDNNIIKKICYNLQGQPVDCGYGTAAAWTAISSTCQTDSNGNTGYMTVVEKDMNPASGTYNTTHNVTIYNPGLCPSCSATCTGENKKCIAGVCRTGVKIYSAAVFSGGQWHCTYYYIWTQDCSVSGDYEEILPSSPLLLEPECP